MARAIAPFIAGALVGCSGGGPSTAERAPPKPPPAADTPEAPSKPTPGPSAIALDASSIGRVFGTEASATADGVVRVTWSRNDVAVTVDGMSFPPAAGLTSWAGFAPTSDHAMVMGDTVVFRDEVDSAMDAAFAHGLEITALHNHFFYDEPKAYFMHVGGHGDADELARGIKAMWDAIRAVRSARPEPASSFPGETPVADEGPVDPASVERITGVKPQVKGTTVKITVAREASMNDMRFGGSMGLTTWAVFTGSEARAAIDGDFAMTANEVQPVLRALRAGGLHVVALHNHMIGEAPPTYFTHFWAKGPASELARAFRAALDAQRGAGQSDPVPATGRTSPERSGPGP